MNLHNCILHPIQKLCVPRGKIPLSVSINEVINKFSQGNHHLGSCPPLPVYQTDDLPYTEYVSHVVRDVTWLFDGKIIISFEFLHTIHGNKCMIEYENGIEFEIIPVLSSSGININRFDIHKMENGVKNYGYRYSS